MVHVHERVSCMTRQVQVLASATSYDVNVKSQLGHVTLHVAIGPNDLRLGHVEFSRIRLDLRVHIERPCMITG